MLNRRPPALLLVGPTGAGKSPLGEHLASRLRWLHLDFGALLRGLAEGGPAPAFVSREQKAAIAGLVASGGLFEGETLPLAVSLVRGEIQRCGAPGVVLNGFPRTPEQVGPALELVDLRLLIELDAPLHVLQQRVARRRRGAGEDHAGRNDDTRAQVSRRVAIYRRQTRPLIALLEAQGLRRIRLEAGVLTTAQDLEEDLGSALASCGLLRPGGRD